VTVQECGLARRNFSIGTREIVQTETFFLVHGCSVESGAEVEQVHRREGIRETRWWSFGEIESTKISSFLPIWWPS